MIVRKLQDAEKTDRRVSAESWQSVRLLLADDNMGFSFHITTIGANTEHTFEYKNHFESVYCISGNGSIEDLATGQVHEISPGVMYALDKHDRHVLRGGTEAMVLACCFNPPVTGQEVHRADGSYAAPDEEAA